MIGTFDENEALFDELADRLIDMNDCEATIRALALKWAMRKLISSAPTFHHAVAIICGELADAATDDMGDTLRKIFEE
jgi:hypothetical protein